MSVICGHCVSDPTSQFENVTRGRYLSLESNFVRDEEIIHIIWVPWMASVNLMTHLKLSSLKMSTKSCRAIRADEASEHHNQFCSSHLSWRATEIKQANNVTMSGDTPPKSGHNSVHNASIMNTWEKSQGGTILGSYRPISAHNGGRKGKDMIHIYSIMYKYTRVIGRRWGASIRHDNDNMIWLWPGRGRGPGRWL